MILYIKQGCPFCGKVLDAIQDLGLARCFKLKDIAEPWVADELVASGGKRQVPYLVDEENNVAIYESGDIVQYLTKQHGVNNE
jgi:glutathione S-transferase